MRLLSASLRYHPAAEDSTKPPYSGALPTLTLFLSFIGRDWQKCFLDSDSAPPRSLDGRVFGAEVTVIGISPHHRRSGFAHGRIGEMLDITHLERPILEERGIEETASPTVGLFLGSLIGTVLLVADSVAHLEQHRTKVNSGKTLQTQDNPSFTTKLGGVLMPKVSYRRDANVNP